jgi:nitrous oxidase accessory protein
MRLAAKSTIMAMAALVAAIAVPCASAETIVVPSSAATKLQAALDAALPGDVVRLGAGQHRGPITLDKAIILEGEPEAVIVGNGQGSVVTITAPKAIVRHLQISGSGKSVDGIDAGVLLAETAQGARVEDNAILGNLYGVYVRGAQDAAVTGNRIVGMHDGRSADAGNAVQVWNAPGARVSGNDIRAGRDGIYVNASKNNVFAGNRFADVRFAVHYMYTHDSEISDNVSIGNMVGYAIMYSSRLTITGNVSDGDRDHGLLLNTTHSSRISGNMVLGRMQARERWTTAGRLRDTHGVPPTGNDGADETADARLGPEKCVFIYNATRNVLTGNRFENCVIGIHFTAGSEGNAISGNAFIRNRNQVKYVGTRYLEWSADGRGNYWSDNPGFDLNSDGISDAPYRPNDLMDRVLWVTPQAKILANSPAVQVLRWAQNRFPALLPGGVFDSHPLMTPPPRERPYP